MADASYQPKVYRKQGAKEFVVASSGKITCESGGEIEVESGGLLEVESGGHVEIEGSTGINVQDGGEIVVSTGGLFAIPVTKSSGVDQDIPNYGFHILTNSGTAAAKDFRLVAGPPRAGLVLHLASIQATSGINVCVATGTALDDIIIRSSDASDATIWKCTGNTARLTLISANTCEWFVSGALSGTLTTLGST